MRSPGLPLLEFGACSSVDRVLASEAKGRWFDSSQARQPPQPSCFVAPTCINRLASNRFTMHDSD